MPGRCIFGSCLTHLRGRPFRAAPRTPAHNSGGDKRVKLNEFALTALSCLQQLARRDFSLSSHHTKLSFCRQQQSCSWRFSRSPHHADPIMQIKSFQWPFAISFAMHRNSQPSAHSLSHSLGEPERESERAAFLLDRAHFSASTATELDAATTKCTRNCCTRRGLPLCYFSKPTRVLLQFHHLILRTHFN